MVRAVLSKMKKLMPIQASDQLIFQHNWTFQYKILLPNNNHQLLILIHDKCIEISQLVNNFKMSKSIPGTFSSVLPQTSHHQRFLNLHRQLWIENIEIKFSSNEDDSWEARVCMRVLSTNYPEQQLTRHYSKTDMYIRLSNSTFNFSITFAFPLTRNIPSCFIPYNTI